MHEQGEEDRSRCEPERSTGASQEEEEPRRGRHQGDVHKQADDSELGRDRERRRVRAVATR